MGEESTCPKNYKSCRKSVNGWSLDKTANYVYISLKFIYFDKKFKNCYVYIIFSWYVILDDGEIYRGCSIHDPEKDFCSNENEDTKWVKTKFRILIRYASKL